MTFEGMKHPLYIVKVYIEKLENEVAYISWNGYTLTFLCSVIYRVSSLLEPCMFLDEHFYLDVHFPPYHDIDKGEKCLLGIPPGV